MSAGPRDDYDEDDMAKELARGKEQGLRTAAAMVMVAAQAHFSTGRDQKAAELRDIAQTILSSHGLK